MKMNRVKLLAGRSNEELAQQISDKLAIPLVKRTLDNFANTETQLEIQETIRGYHMFIIATGGFSSKLSINDYKDEINLMINACKLSNAKSITLVCPCFPNARQDKKDAPRVSISSAMNITIWESLGVNRFVTMDLHSGQIQGMARNPMDNLYAIKLYVNKFNEILFKGLNTDEINSKYILASPDNGGIKRVEAYAKRLSMDFVLMHKQRDYSQKNTVLKSMLIGDPKNLFGKTVILIDDIADTMGTMVAAANELKIHGAKDAIIVVTHGIFAGPAFERINNCDMISKIFVTNSLPQEENLKKTNKLIIVDISELLSQVIVCLRTGKSVSALFE